MAQQIFKTFEKDPDAKLDYECNWELEISPDTIGTSTWESDDGGVSLSDDSKTDFTATVTVSGGDDGGTYTIVNHIVMASGLEDSRRIKFKICEQ